MYILKHLHQLEQHVISTDAIVSSYLFLLFPTFSIMYEMYFFLSYISIKNS